MWESGFSKLFDPIHDLDARILRKQPADFSTVAKLQCAFDYGG